LISKKNKKLTAMTLVWFKLANSGVKYWRLIVKHRNQTPEKFEHKSLILGDWLRHNYISIGDDIEHISRERFDKMQEGDKIAVVSDEYIWAIGYRIENVHLHSVRRNVIWDKITRLKQDDFHNSLKAELKKPDTIVSLNEAEWNKILERL
jgi:hypothetical protein